MIASDHPMRLWRKRKRVTLGTLADEVGVTPSHLSEIERGLNKPSLPLTARLSSATADERGVPEVSMEAIAAAIPSEAAQ